MTLLVDLADEFELTTVDALDLCRELGIDATASNSELADQEAERFRVGARELWARRRAEEEAIAATGGSMPLAPLVAQTDFTQVPSSWQEAARTPPPPPPGSQGVERLAVLSVVAAGISLVVSLLTGLCGVLVALVPVGLSVRAKNAMAERATSGKGLVLLARLGAIVSIVIALGVTWVAYTGNIDKLPTLAVLDLFAPGELVSADDVGPGDCVLEPESTPGAEQLLIVQVVSCTSKHDVEYFAALDTFGITPIEDLDDFPGDESIKSVMFSECRPLWEEFTGSTLGTSELDLAIFYPTERAWKAGDRGLLCGVASLDGSPLEGSMAGSGR